MDNASSSRSALYITAYRLAVLTILYNAVEGIVSVWLGAEDETLSLFGFGVDSFVEVVSGIGIWHMVRRIRSSGEGSLDAFEQQALRITGYAFYVLAAGLVASAVLSLVQQHRPVSTVWGVIVSLVSISFMWLLIRYKMKVGTALGSSAILADAACSRACVYLSISLLLSSAGYQLTGLGFFDAAGALLIAYFSWREGAEALLKAKGLCCCKGTCG